MPGMVTSAASNGGVYIQDVCNSEVDAPKGTNPKKRKYLVTRQYP